VGQAQADQVADLLDQVRIGRDLELVLSPGLEPEGTPDLTDGLSADPVPLGHRPGRPVCGVLGSSLGVVSSVSTITTSTTSSQIVRAAPGLGASTSPSSPSSRSAANRWRHLPTVTLSQPSSSAILVFGLPSAQASTIRDRNAKACDDECRRDRRTSVSRSSPVSSIATVGRPARPSPAPSVEALASSEPVQNLLQTTKSRFHENSSTDQPDRTLGVCQPRQEAALRPAAANGLGAQSRPVEHRQADDAVARGAAIAKCRYRRRDSDPLR
jgi:hypothetical protein